MSRILTISLLLISFSFGIGAQNTWNKLAFFAGDKREKAVGLAIGNMGYVGLGKDTAEAVRDDFWQFDPAANTWTQKATFPGVARIGAISFVVGNKGYVGTGQDAAFNGNRLLDFYEYNPATNSWQIKAPYPDSFNGWGIKEATGFAIGSKGYVCGGRWGSDPWYSDRLWEYDQGNDIWTQKADFPGGDRYGLCSFVVNGKAYVGTGTDHDLTRKDIWEYDPGTDSWVQKADLPGTQRTEASTFVINDSLGYIVFGTNGGFLDELWEYNPIFDSWTIKAPFPGDGRRNAVAFTINGRGYGGIGQSQSGARRNFYEYAPTTPPPPIGLNELVDDNHSAVFPNPMVASAIVSVDSKIVLREARLIIYDLYGKQVKTITNIENNRMIIYRDKLSQGTYFYQLSNLTGVAANEQIIGSGKLIVL